MWILLATLVAVAADLSVSTDAAGTVHASAVVPATPAVALALVRDPVAVLKLSGEAGTLAAKPTATCYDVAYALENILINVAYTARACQTVTGVRSQLVQSDSFKQMSTEWTVREVPGGSELVYTYTAELNVPVPNWLIRKRTEASIATMMQAVVGKLGG